MNVEIFTLSISRKAGGVKDAVKDLFLHHEFSQQGVKLHISSYHDIASDIDKEEWTPLPLSLYKSKTFFGYSKAIKQALLQSNADYYMYTDYGDTHMLLCINGNKKKTNL